MRRCSISLAARLVFPSLLLLTACAQKQAVKGESEECVRPVRDGCFVSMYQVIANPEKFSGMRVSFLSFYAPAFGRPTFFLNKEGWILSDAPSAIVVSRMDEDFYRSESTIRFSYVRASGVISTNPVTRIEPHISLSDVVVQPIIESDGLLRMQAVRESEARIGLTEEEYYRLGIEGNEQKSR